MRIKLADIRDSMRFDTKEEIIQDLEAGKLEEAREQGGKN